VLKWTFTHIRLAAIIQIMIAAACLAWTLFIWVNVDTFGSSPECNANIKYVLFVFFRQGYCFVVEEVLDHYSWYIGRQHGDGYHYCHSPHFKLVGTLEVGT
jgi:hypothetical protein